MKRFYLVEFILFTVWAIPADDSLSASSYDLFRRSEALAPLYASLPENGETPNDQLLIQRILKTYKTYTSEDDNRSNSMWDHIFNEYHLPIHHIFMADDLQRSSSIFRHPGSTDLFYGIDNLTKTLSSRASSTLETLRCLDGLVRFAEAIGAIPLDHPETYPRRRAVPWKGDDVVNRIEISLGQVLDFPNPYPQEAGAQTSRGIVSYRTPQALYQAWRIKEILKNVEHPRVLEIGAGVGRTAYYARKWGIQDYTIVDLPFTAAISAYFLGRTLGENQIALHGENDFSSDCVKIIYPTDFLNGNEKYDLIINVDSMTEMPRKIARTYMKKIEESSTFFLSINHEANPFTVKDLIRESSGVLHVDRAPYWMRQGYVEELVQFSRD